MRLQDHMIDETRAAMEEAFNYARAVPEDKLGWKPMDAGRSVIELARELAQCPDWAYDLVSTGAMAFDEEAMAATNASLTTVEACEAMAKEKLGRYFELLKEFPEERMAETIDLPFGPGGSMKTFTMTEMVYYPRWNATYHTGQIAYMQTLYGDKDIH